MSALAPVIPADIRQTALDVIEFTSVMSFRLDQVEVVAAAILAERERCAQIAEGVGRDASRDRDIFVMTGVAGLSRVIAEAIRNPHLPSGAAACSADTAGTEPPPSVPADQFESEAEAEIARLERVIEKSGGIGNALSAMLGVDVEIVRADGGADITMKHSNIAGAA